MFAGSKRPRTGGIKDYFGPKSVRQRYRRRAARMPRSLSSALGRVHVFKRVGNPVVIQARAAPTLALVAPGSNATMIAGNGALAATVDSYVTFANQVRGAFKFMLSQCAETAEITSLFDNYRIRKVRLAFMYSGTDASTGLQGAASASLACPIMHYCYDPDDNKTPGTREEVMASGYAKTTRLDRIVYVDIVPRAQTPVTNGPTTSGGASTVVATGGLMSRNQWFDSTNASVEFYGLKFWIDQFPSVASDNQYALTITPTFYIEGKNVV